MKFTVYITVSELFVIVTLLETDQKWVSPLVILENGNDVTPQFFGTVAQLKIFAYLSSLKSYSTFSVWVGFAL